MKSTDTQEAATQPRAERTTEQDVASSTFAVHRTGSLVCRVNRFAHHTFRAVPRVRRRRGFTDGPFAETKEMLGSF